MDQLVRHATRVQHEVDKVRERLRDHEVSSEGASGQVRVTVTCAGAIRRIEVAPSFFDEEGLDMTLDMIAATANKALGLADQTVEAEVTEATGGLRIPGLNA